jgi:predicted membrane protein (TIGR00267 family)
MNNKQLMSHILRASSIARRYLVTNGFDGTLTMLGMLTGFYISGTTDLSVAISACLGAAIALFISGLSSAYLSEKAERKKELRELEQALVHKLDESDYGQASRFLPMLVALVNGLSPLLLSLLILMPLFAVKQGYTLPFSPFINAIIIALICIFFLGVFLGKISGSFWLWSGLRTLIIAIVTVAIILFFGQPYASPQ